ncbi:MAG: hypothetical protein U0168_14135 [Nannocystaceae bacterium]
MANIEPALQSAVESAQNDRLGRLLLGAIRAAIATGIEVFIKASRRTSLPRRTGYIRSTPCSQGDGARRRCCSTCRAGQEPALQHLLDAVLYVATSLSVGYDDVRQRGAATPALVQSVGPALAANALSLGGDAAATADHNAAVQRQILTQLEEIATLLRAQAAAQRSAR